MSKKEKTYEEVYAELEELVKSIEDPRRDLSTVAGDIRKALEMISWCRDYIRGDREKIEELFNNGEDRQ